jgi:hypothetical protein
MFSLALSGTDRIETGCKTQDDCVPCNHAFKKAYSTENQLGVVHHQDQEKSARNQWDLAAMP